MADIVEIMGVIIEEDTNYILSKAKGEIMEAIKLIAGCVSSISASSVSTRIIKNLLGNVDNLSKIKKLGILIGTSAIAGMIGDKAGNYVEDEITKIANVFHSVKVDVSPVEDAEVVSD